MKNGIINKLNEDIRSNIDIIHLIKRDLVDILYYKESVGIAVKAECGTCFAVPFSDDYEPLYFSLDGEELICMHSKEMSEHYLSLGYKHNGACYTFSYFGGKIEEDNSHDFRLLREDEIPFILKYYNSNEESLSYDIRRENLFCLEDDGVVKGFAGFHAEEAMGLLVVLPQFRKAGLGRAMEIHIINEAINRGWTPFCNVYTTNEVSINLQHSLGLEEGKDLSYWMWRPDA